MSDQTRIEDLPREYHLDDGDLVILIAPEVIETHAGRVEFLVFASLGLSKYGQQDIILCPGTRDSRIANSAIRDILTYYGFSLLLTDATTEILYDALRNNTPLNLQFLEGPITTFHLRLAP